MSRNNHVALIGNMGEDPKIIKTDDKTTMAAFSLATQEAYRDQSGEWQNRAPDWHNILVFKDSEIEKLQNLKKGSRIQIIGSLSYREIKAISDKGKTYKAKKASVIANEIGFVPTDPK